MVAKKRAKLEDDDGDDLDAFYDATREKVLIDKHALDDMWLEQPGIIQDLGERIAMEISRRDQAKDDLADTIATVDTQVREHHAEDEKKPTETAIKNEVAQDRLVQAAKQQLRKLELNVQRLQALMTTFTARRYALQDLTTLYVAGYFTSNSGSAKDARDRKGATGREAMQAERKRRERE